MVLMHEDTYRFWKNAKIMTLTFKIKRKSCPVEKLRWEKLLTFSMGLRNVRGRISTLTGTIIGVVRGSQLISPNGSDSKGEYQIKSIPNPYHFPICILLRNSPAKPFQMIPVRVGKVIDIFDGTEECAGAYINADRNYNWSRPWQSAYLPQWLGFQTGIVS
ncbi:hypothetical protein CEXT_701061 [Caerostris extrusa]|uniref:Uncharacterized protein n=1 Tax=Caerostris extrusa TaxID=172846 RepID=A0AAV4SIG2_CAEEX|nr:hypothetical protein CEXT_701061 [Caerostris extrusa]